MRCFDPEVPPYYIQFNAIALASTTSERIQYVTQHSPHSICTAYIHTYIHMFVHTCASNTCRPTEVVYTMMTRMDRRRARMRNKTSDTSTRDSVMLSAAFFARREINRLKVRLVAK